MAAIRITYLKAALQDWIDSYEWYSEAEFEIAEQFEQEIIKGIDFIKRHPESGGFLGDGLRKIKLPSYPFSIIYELNKEKELWQVVIVSIAHEKRRPGFWKNRY